MHSASRNLAVTVLAAAVATFAAGPVSAQSDRIRRILRETPLVDGHNDVPEQYLDRVKDRLDRIDLASDTSTLTPPMHTDIPRLKAGGVGGQFWSVYVSPQLPGAEAVQATLDQIDLVKRLVARYPETFEMAWTSGDILRIHKAGKIASLIGMEGGHSINNSLATLREMYRFGRALHDADALGEQRVGRRRDGSARARRPDAVWRDGRARDEPAGHARRSLARLGADDEQGARRDEGARHLLALVRAARSTGTRATSPTPC